MDDIKNKVIAALKTFLGLFPSSKRASERKKQAKKMNNWVLQHSRFIRRQRAIGAFHGKKNMSIEELYKEYLLWIDERQAIKRKHKAN